MASFAKDYSSNSKKDKISPSGSEQSTGGGPNLNVTTVIQEGFICAECHRQFSGVDELLRHYQSHSSGTGSASGTFKGFLGKAKQKLQVLNNPQTQQQIGQQISLSLNTQNPVQQSIQTTTPTYHDNVGTNYQQIVGTTRSHYELFKKYRSSRIERYASEGNKLVIRLFKLMSSINIASINIGDSSVVSSTSTDERRAHEKSVVQWVDEKQVNRCPDCAVAFSTLLLRRKHHCRLCGSVLCDECSKFITLEEAKLLTGRLRGSSSAMDHYSDQGKEYSGAESRKSAAGRRNSNPLGTASSHEITFRSCAYCYSLLQQQRTRIEQQLLSSPTDNPNIASGTNMLKTLYANLQENISQIQNLTPDLIKISDSLNAGESLYSLQQGNELRSKLIKLTESIDNISKRICGLGVVHDESGNVNNSLLLLQQRIRQSSIVFIRDILGELPLLPTEDKLLMIKEEIQRGQNLGGSGHDVGNGFRRRKRDDEFVEVLPGSGWSASVPASSTNYQTDVEAHVAKQSFYNDFEDSKDPIMQQIDNVTFYIKQAKDANKWDEVGLLESSLADLLKEMKIKKQMKKSYLN